MSTVVEALNQISAREWNHATVDDGQWLNDKTILPLSARDVFIAGCIDELDDTIKLIKSDTELNIEVQDFFESTKVNDLQIKNVEDIDDTNFIESDYITNDGTLATYTFSSGTPSDENPTNIYGFDRLGNFINITSSFLQKAEQRNGDIEEGTSIFGYSSTAKDNSFIFGHAEQSGTDESYIVDLSANTAAKSFIFGSVNSLATSNSQIINSDHSSASNNAFVLNTTFGSADNNSYIVGTRTDSQNTAKDNGYIIANYSTGNNATNSGMILVNSTNNNSAANDSYLLGTNNGGCGYSDYSSFIFTITSNCHDSALYDSFIFTISGSGTNSATNESFIFTKGGNTANQSIIFGATNTAYDASVIGCVNSASGNAVLGHNNQSTGGYIFGTNNLSNFSNDKNSYLVGHTNTGDSNSYVFGAQNDSQCDSYILGFANSGIENTYLLGSDVHDVEKDYILGFDIDDNSNSYIFGANISGERDCHDLGFGFADNSSCYIFGADTTANKDSIILGYNNEGNSGGFVFGCNLTASGGCIIGGHAYTNGEAEHTGCFSPCAHNIFGTITASDVTGCNAYNSAAFMGNGIACSSYLDTDKTISLAVVADFSDTTVTASMGPATGIIMKTGLQNNMPFISAQEFLVCTNTTTYAVLSTILELSATIDDIIAQRNPPAAQVTTEEESEPV